MEPNSTTAGVSIGLKYNGASRGRELSNNVRTHHGGQESGGDGYKSCSAHWLPFQN